MDVKNQIINALLNDENVKETVIFSNTPWFFLKQLRSANVIKNIADNIETDELINIFNETIENQNYDLDKKILLYSLIAILTFKETSKVNNFFTNLDKFNLFWLKEMQNLYFAKLANLNISNYKVSNKIFINENKFNRIDEQTTIIENKYNPKIVQR